MNEIHLWAWCCILNNNDDKNLPNGIADQNTNILLQYFLFREWCRHLLGTFSFFWPAYKWKSYWFGLITCLEYMIGSNQLSSWLNYFRKPADICITLGNVLPWQTQFWSIEFDQEDFLSFFPKKSLVHKTSHSGPIHGSIKALQKGFSCAEKPFCRFVICALQTPGKTRS